jgi:hypothetical protein
MYAKNNKSRDGVRIKMNCPPFIEHYTLPSHHGGRYTPVMPSVLPIELWKSHISKDMICFPIEYTDDPKRLYPKVQRVNDAIDRIDLVLEDLGRCKNTRWEFQNEWRYIIAILPLSYNLNMRIKYDINAKLLFQHDYDVFRELLDKGEADCGFSYMDIGINDEALNDIEITLSPTISENSRNIVESLVHYYVPYVKISESELSGLIKLR